MNRWATEKVNNGNPLPDLEPTDEGGYSTGCKGGYRVHLSFSFLGRVVGVQKRRL